MSQKNKKRLQPAKRRNWAAIDARHARRGEIITVFLCDDEGLHEPPQYAVGRRGGRPRLYDDSAGRRRLRWPRGSVAVAQR